MLRRMTPDGGRIDDHALSTWRGRFPRRSDGAGLLFVVFLMFVLIRLSGCMGAF